MKNLLLIQLILLAPLFVLGQVDQDICSTVDGNLKSASLLDYSDLTNEPIKYVRVNLVFLRKNDGTGGFQKNNADHQQFISDKINNANYYMGAVPSSYDNSCYNGSLGTFAETKIRFEFDTIYVNNSTAWDNSPSGTSCSMLPSYLVALNTSINNSLSHPAINVFYTEDSNSYNNIVVSQNCPISNGIPTTSCTQRPSYTNFSINRNVHMRGNFTKYYWMMNCVVDNVNWDYPSEETVYDWLHPGRIEAHELCHVLDLADIERPDGSCAQHLMMHNDGGYGFFLSPVEIADMHQALSESSARKYVREDTYSASPIVISSDTSWSRSLRIYRGISHTTGTFQINSELIAPAEVDIVTTNNAYLEFNNATVSPANTNSRPELRATFNATVEINNSTISDFDVSIEDNAEIIINNSTINIPNGGIFTTESGTVFTMNSGLIQ